MTELIALIIVAALFAYREYHNHKAQSDLLDRLMARSLPEYKDNQTAEENHFEPEEVLPDVEEAKEELYGDQEEE